MGKGLPVVVGYSTLVGQITCDNIVYVARHQNIRKTTGYVHQSTRTISDRMCVTLTACQHEKCHRKWHQVPFWVSPKALEPAHVT